MILWILSLSLSLRYGVMILFFILFDDELIRQEFWASNECMPQGDTIFFGVLTVQNQFLFEKFSFPSPKNYFL